MSEICDECEGVGLVETWRDVAVRGEHATEESIEDCEACNGTGRVFCDGCPRGHAVWLVSDGGEEAKLCEECARDALTDGKATACRLDGKAVRP